MPQPVQCLPRWSQESARSHEQGGAEPRLRDGLLSWSLLIDKLWFSVQFPLHWFVWIHTCSEYTSHKEQLLSSCAEERGNCWLSASLFGVTWPRGEAKRFNSKKQGTRDYFFESQLKYLEWSSVHLTGPAVWWNKPEMRQTRRTATIKKCQTW